MILFTSRSIEYVAENMCTKGSPYKGDTYLEKDGIVPLSHGRCLIMLRTNL